MKTIKERRAHDHAMKYPPGRNDDPVGGSELFTRLSGYDPEVERIADAIKHGLSPDVRAPIAIAALTRALAEAILANTSPPQQWAAVVAKRLQTMVSLFPAAPTAPTD
jgi:hypothetical protein